MFRITGGSAVIRAASDQTDQAWIEILATRTHQVPCRQFCFYDLIFPLFMFISGAVVPFALISKLEQDQSAWRLRLRVLKRAGLLALLGLIYNGALQFEFTTLRWASVLGQIRVAYFLAAIIAISMPTLRAISIWIIGILTAIVALHLFVPVPDHGAGVFTGVGSINGYVDRLLLPGRLLGKTVAPEGILCVFSAVSVTLMRVWAGLILRNEDLKPRGKILVFCGTGVVIISAAILLKDQYPIIESFWTSTYNLFVGGIIFLCWPCFTL